MEKKKANKPLYIRFHNPNTPEETAKHLVKIIAENIAENIIIKKQEAKSALLNTS